MESMGVVSRCGCKEVYRFPQNTYPYSSCICSFFSSIPTFLFIFIMFFVLVIIIITRKFYSAGRANARSTYVVIH